MHLTYLFSFHRVLVHLGVHLPDDGGLWFLLSPSEGPSSGLPGGGPARGRPSPALRRAGLRRGGQC